MSITSLSTRRQILAGVIALTSVVAPFAAAAETVQPVTIQPGSAEERLQLSSTAARPTSRSPAAVRASARSPREFATSAPTGRRVDAYARSMRGM